MGKYHKKKVQGTIFRKDPWYMKAGRDGRLIPMRRGYGEPLELCLCGRCAGAFYHLPNHIIRRVDHDQYFKDKCDYCGQRYGYDYLVYEKQTSLSHFS